jgi:hypothetical protein
MRARGCERGMWVRWYNECLLQLIMLWHLASLTISPHDTLITHIHTPTPTQAEREKKTACGLCCRHPSGEYQAVTPSTFPQSQRFPQRGTVLCVCPCVCVCVTKTKKQIQSESERESDRNTRTHAHTHIISDPGGHKCRQTLQGNGMQKHTPSNVIDEPLTSMPMIVKDLRGPLKKAEALP